ncbi:MAG TPA: hypothetical protein VF721_11600, partial [Pyrinomonadaceae bacterium]
MWKRLALILFFSVSISAQPPQPENLYARSLQACLEKEFESYSKFSDRDLENVSVVGDYKLTDDLPTRIGKFTLDYLNGDQLNEKFKSLAKTKYKERGEIPVIVIFPL